MKKTRKAKRCVDCQKEIRRRRGTTSNYVGDLCWLCKNIRTTLNKKKYEKNYRGTPLEMAIRKVIQNYGLSTTIKDKIGSRVEKEFVAFMNKVQTVARLEARRVTYALLLNLGAQAFFNQDHRKSIRSKMIREIGEAMKGLK